MYLVKLLPVLLCGALLVLGGELAVDGGADLSHPLLGAGGHGLQPLHLLQLLLLFLHLHHHHLLQPRFHLGAATRITDPPRRKICCNFFNMSLFVDQKMSSLGFGDTYCTLLIFWGGDLANLDLA